MEFMIRFSGHVELTDDFYTAIEMWQSASDAILKCGEHPLVQSGDRNLNDASLMSFTDSCSRETCDPDKFYELWDYYLQTRKTMTFDEAIRVLSPQETKNYLQ